jgi:hypothetical protein
MLLAKELYCENLLFGGFSGAAAGELSSLEEQILAYRNEIAELRSRLSTIEAALKELTADFEAGPRADRLYSNPNCQLSSPPIKPKTWTPVEVTD